LAILIKTLLHLAGVELELECDQLVEGIWIWKVVPEELDEELVTLELALERVEDHV